MSEQNSYFIKIRGRTLGPFEVTRLRQMVQQGQISRVNPISSDGLQWQKAGDLTELFQAMAPPAALSSSGDGSAAAASQGQRAPAGLASPAEINGGLRPGAAGAWYYGMGDHYEGPATIGVLRQLISSGQLTDANLVWREGMSEWAPLGTIPELAAYLPASALGREATDAGGGDTVDLQRCRTTVANFFSWSVFALVLGSIFSTLVLLVSVFFFIQAAANRDLEFLFPAVSQALYSAFLLTISIYCYQMGACASRFHQTGRTEELDRSLRWVGRIMRLTCHVAAASLAVLVLLFLLGFFAGAIGVSPSDFW